MIATGVQGGRIAEDLYSVSVKNDVGPSGQPTNVYIAGRGSAVIIDTGSDDGGATVLNALERFAIGEVDIIVLTHAHQDHAGNASALQRLTGARLGLHPRDLGLSGRWQVEMQVDHLLRDGEIVDARPYQFQVIETPGHAPGHVSLYEPTLRALFAGDLISGNGTIAVVPPNGSMRDYLHSLRRVRSLDIDTIYPGHGPAIHNGSDRIQEYIDHRERREQDIFDCFASGSDTIDAIIDRLYPDVLARNRGAAAGTVLAHILHLIEQGRMHVIDEGRSMLESRYAIAG